MGSLLLSRPWEASLTARVVTWEANHIPPLYFCSLTVSSLCPMVSIDVDFV